MLKSLFKKLLIPLGALFVLSIISNNLDVVDRITPDLIVDYTYYISGIGIWLVVAWILSICVNVVVWEEYFRKRKGIEPPDVIETLTFLAILVLALMGIIGVVFDQSVTGIWTMTTVAGGVIGFALKDMIADFFVGIAINLDKTFKVGDWVTIEDESGKKIVGWIEEITWRTTRIGQQNGTTLIYPNSIMSKVPFRNLSMNGPERRYELEFIIDPNIDCEKVIRVLTAAVRSVPGIMKDPKAEAVIEESTFSGMLYEVRYWLNPDKVPPRKIKSRVMYAILHHLKQANIPISLSADQYISSMPERYVDLDKHRERIIDKVATLKLLNDNEKQYLASIMERKAFKEKSTVIKQGAGGDSIFILVEGVMDVYIFNREQNAELKVGQVYPGEFFGEKSLLTGELRSATVVAASDCVAYEITKEHMLPIMKSRPKLVEQISKYMAKRDVENSTLFANYSAGQRNQEQLRSEKTFIEKMKDFFGFEDEGPEVPSSSSTGIENRNPFSYH